MERHAFPGSTAACDSSSEADLDGAVITDGKPVTFYGMARLDVPLAGASLDIVDAEGKSLLEAPVSVTGSGLFYCTTPLPTNFRLVANSPTAGKVYRAVRNHDGTPRMVGINVATHLLALYLDRYPTVALITAEARVRSYLALPPGTSLDTGLDAQRGPFSSQVFMREAGKAGGFQSHCTNLVEHIHMGLRRPFILADENGGPGFGMSVLSNVAGDLVAAPISAGIDKAFGWLAGLMGFHLGGPSLKDVSRQLTEVQSQLTAIQNQIGKLQTQGAYALAATAVQPYVDSITQANTTLSDAVSAQTSDDGPVDPSSDTELNRTLWAKSWPDECNAILSYLLGRNQASNMVSSYKAVVMNGYGADSQPGLYQGYPLRSNAILDVLEQQLQSYLGTVALGVNLYAEVSHLCTRDATTGNFNNIAEPVMLAKVQINQIIADYTQAAQQLPGPLGTDDVLIDMENRVTWYLPVWPTWTEVDAFNLSPASGAYGGAAQGKTPFKPATKKQLDKLRERLLAMSPSAPVAAMQALGFDFADNSVDVSNDKLHVWMYETDENGDWVSGAYYRMEDGSTDHVKSSDLDKAKYPSLQALGFPLQDVEDDPANPLLGSAVPGIAPGSLSIVVDPRGANTMQALTNSTPIFGGGTFVVDQKQHSVPVATAARGQYDVTDYVVWSSSNPSAADISNLDDGTAGNITWHPTNVEPGSTQVTFTATVYSQPGVQPSASVTLTAASSLPTAPTLQSIVILPDNLLYGMPARNEYYQATGFYSDQTAVDVSNRVTWSVVDTATGAAVPSEQAGFTTTQNNLLVIDSNTLKSPNLTITASLGGVTGSANVRVPIPLSST